MAIGLQRDAARETDLLAWIVTVEPHEHRVRVAARLVASTPTPYLLLADSLADLREILPTGLERFERAPNDPPEVAEIWFLVTK
jgi:hypothetical protein